MKIKRYNTRKEYFYIFFIEFFFTIGFLVKILSDRFLDKKYFYDTNKIFSLIINNTTTGDKAFDFTKNVFSIFNLSLSFSDIIIFFVTATIIFLAFLKKPPISNNKFFYIILPMWIFIFNIYNNTLSKEMIQFFISLLIAFILYTQRKLILINLYLGIILLYFSFSFRSYLILQLLVFYALQFVFFKKSDIKNRIIIILMVLVFVIGFLSIKCPNLLNSLISARSGVNEFRANDPEANTIINDIIINSNNNVIIFIINSVINIFRFSIPLELLKLFSIKYVFFIVYQLLITFLVLRNVKEYKKLNSKSCLVLFITISVFYIQVIFEPDFGSYLKHQTAYIPFLYLCIFRKEYLDS